jgi:hypothetical protein
MRAHCDWLEVHFCCVYLYTDTNANRTALPEPAFESACLQEEATYSDNAPATGMVSILKFVIEILERQVSVSEYASCMSFSSHVSGAGYRDRLVALWRRSSGVRC